MNNYTYKEYLLKYIGEEKYDKIKDGDFNYDRKIRKTDDLVSISGILVPLENVPSLLGFDSKYSVEYKCPNLAANWLPENVDKPENVFYKSNQLVAVKDGKNTIYLNLKNYDEKESEIYITFINTNKFKKIAIDREEFNISKMLERYCDFCEFILGRVPLDDEEVSITIASIDTYFKNMEVLMPSYRTIELIIHKSIFAILGIEYNFKTINWNINLNSRVISHKEILDLIEAIGNPRLKYIIYGTYLGLGDDKYLPIRNLKMRDIDKEKMIAYGLTESGIKKYKIDETFIEIAEECNSLKKNVELILNGVKTPTYKFNMESPYIYKSKITKLTDKGMAPVNYTSIHTFFKRIDKEFKMNDRLKKYDLELSYTVNTMYNIYLETGIKWTEAKIEKYAEEINAKTNPRHIMIAYNDYYNVK